MNVLRTSIVLLALLAVAVLTTVGDDNGARTQSVRRWKSPSEKPYRRQDGFRQYAASWPTWAVICTYVPSAPDAEERVAMPDATLFLMAAPQLKEADLAASIPTAARFATACPSKARGHWVRFSPQPSEPYFVLVEPGTGNCGDEIRIFGHSVAYDSPHVGKTAFQDHTFSQVFSRGCINSPLLADIDGDGFPELLVNEMISNGRSRAGSEYGYRIIKLKKGEFTVVGDLDDSGIEALRKAKKL